MSLVPSVMLGLVICTQDVTNPFGGIFAHYERFSMAQMCLLKTFDLSKHMLGPVLFLITL